MKSGVILSCLYDDWTCGEELFREVGEGLRQRGGAWQLVLVDDGSLEARPPRFLEEVPGFASIVVVRLRRNLGHQRAIAVGLSHIFESTEGAAIAVMDSDGQDTAIDLFRLIETHETQAQPCVVFAERARRSESVAFRLLYSIYRALHLLLTGYRIRFGNFSVVPRALLGRLIVDPNLWLHFAATVVSSRTPHMTIPSQRGKRLHGDSKLNFIALVIHGLAALGCYNEIIGVRLIFSGLTFGAMLFALMMDVLVIRLTTTWAVSGWATYTFSLLAVLLVQVLLIVIFFVAMAISGRKAHFFLPVQQYKLFIDEIVPIR